MTQWSLPGKFPLRCYSSAAPAASAMTRAKVSWRKMSRLHSVWDCGSLWRWTQWTRRTEWRRDMTDVIIRGGTVVTPEGIVEADVAIEDGRISAIGSDLP